CASLFELILFLLDGGLGVGKDRLQFVHRLAVLIIDAAHGAREVIIISAVFRIAGGLDFFGDRFRGLVEPVLQSVPLLSRRAMIVADPVELLPNVLLLLA